MTSPAPEPRAAAAPAPAPSTAATAPKPLTKALEDAMFAKATAPLGRLGFGQVGLKEFFYKK